MKNRLRVERVIKVIMKIIKEQVDLNTIWSNRDTRFEDMMKIVVDIKLCIIAIDADMQADLEYYLLNEGSKQTDLWGANIYPFKEGDDFIEYTSFINIRPSMGNRKMVVESFQIRESMRQIVEKLLKK
jgi:hypothetical protein